MMDSDHKQVAIVTGANTGIGRETALSLAKDGMKVFMACRSADRGHEAASYIREACPEADVEVLLLDLKTLESVRKCAREFKSRNVPLKLLVNNAGVTLGTPWYTAEGVGGSAQVNYLGHYVLTRLLEDSLVAGAPSRVVNVTSIMSRGVTIPDPEKFFKDFKSGQYSQAKLANILFSFELQRRWQEITKAIASTGLLKKCVAMLSGKGIQACAVDPGAVRSDIWRRSRYNKPPISWFMKVAFAPTWDGATPVYHAATTRLKTEQDKTPLRLFARGGFAWWGVTKPNPTPILQLIGAALDWPVRHLSRGMFFGKVEEVPANPQAYDETVASKLWSLSADIAGLSD